MLLVIRKTVEGLNWMCAQTLAGATAAAATRVKLVKFIHMLRKNCLEKLQTGINKFSLSHPLRRLSLSRIAWSIFSASLFSSNFGGKHSTPTLQTECHILIFPNFSCSPYFFHFSYFLFCLVRLLPECVFQHIMLQNCVWRLWTLGRRCVCVSDRVPFRSYCRHSPFLVCSFYYIVIFIMHNVWLLPSFSYKNAGKRFASVCLCSCALRISPIHQLCRT